MWSGSALLTCWEAIPLTPDTAKLIVYLCLVDQGSQCAGGALGIRSSQCGDYWHPYIKNRTRGEDSWCAAQSRKFEMDGEPWPRYRGSIHGGCERKRQCSARWTPERRSYGLTGHLNEWG